MVKEIFSPTEKEIKHAERVLSAYKEALGRNSGVIALDGKMIDTPIVNRAERVLAYAAAVQK